MKSKKNNKDRLLSKEDLRQRGWSGRKIFHLAPKPIYRENEPYWKLRDIENIEADMSFYLFNEVIDG